jgi:uncharacterized protein (TIGR03067 family)
MRRIIVKPVTCLFILAIASTGLGADPKSPAKESAVLNGKWTLTSGVTSGEKMTDEVLKSIQLVLANGKYTAKVGDDTDQGTYKIDQSTTPNTLTLTGTSGPNKGKTMLAIFELEKGTLKVCYDMSGKAFPKEFESKPSTSSFLATYERQKFSRRPARLGVGVKQ